MLLGDAQAEILSASDDRVLVRLPEGASALGIALSVRGESSAVHPFLLATRLAGDVHPVAVHYFLDWLKVDYTRMFLLQAFLSG